LSLNYTVLFERFYFNRCSFTKNNPIEGSIFTINLKCVVNNSTSLIISLG